MKPTTPQQIEATIAIVRAAAAGDPLDAVSLYRGHFAMVLGALDEAQRERDEANERHAALAEHVVACLPYEAETDGEALDAWECVDAASREIARLQRERDEARAALASEPARIAAAEMARDVAWVRAIEACGGNSARYVQYVFNVPGYYDAARVQYAANHGEDIAAAIRAARGQS